ncbi:MFS transporter, PPP family, 3-phenylpropionic acid transporter [Kaistia soli DSM 19436]|uniref:MFS transporter, PPP family, 3-phenylpropionic acid transporter n=1 Tax=Kaistia soli DSM 19436 TaxID=1122133 RepID=A0A1M5GTJ1_9HYPH|nr:MFS transporter [Kaistia soli]SHG06987.1 MFS transporter, PPP family, 3-phenylpropionic acid transporter [Kaistia soli DSM 19436]
MNAAPSLFSARLSFFYAASFLVSGITVPFLPVWLMERGFGPQEIAACLAFPLAARLIATPAGSWLADRAPNRRMAIVLFALLGLLFFVPATLAQGNLLILVLTGLAVTAWSLIQPAVDALSLTGVRRFGLDYGRMRVWGSISFVCASLGAGVIFGAFGAPILAPLIIAGFATCLAVAFLLPVTPKAERLADDASRQPRKSARTILLSPSFLVIASTTGLIQASHGIFYSFGTIEWQALGFSGSEIGVLWATGVVAEIVMFAISSRFLRLRAETLILAGALAAVIRWALLPLITSFAMTFLLQSLHAFTFGATFVGMQLAIARTVPEEMTASAQGLCMMSAGGLMALTTLMAGTLYERLGVHAYWVMSAFAALAVIIIVVARLRAQPQRAGVGGLTKLPR